VWLGVDRRSSEQGWLHPVDLATELGDGVVDVLDRPLQGGPNERDSTSAFAITGVAKRVNAIGGVRVM
jgi:hypothetical protein